MLKSAAAALLVGAAVLVDAAHNITVYNNDTSVAYTGSPGVHIPTVVDQNTPTVKANSSPSTSPVSNPKFARQRAFPTHPSLRLIYPPLLPSPRLQNNLVPCTGTAIYVVGTESQEGGIVTFNLDGTTSTFDRYAVPPYRCGVPWYGKSGLADSQHILTVTFSGNSPENTTAGIAFLEWMWLEYTVPDAGDGAATTTSPTSSLPIGTGSAAPASSTSASPATVGATKSNGAAIGGGIAAAVVAVLVIAGVIWYCIRRKNRDNAYVGARPDLDPSSPRNNNFAGGFAGGMPSPGRQMAQNQEGRHSINYGNQPVAQTTPWMPDATSAASLSPAAQGSYNPITGLAAGAVAGGAAGAMMNQHNNNAGYNPSTHGGSVSPGAGYAPYGQPAQSAGPFATPAPTLDHQTSYASSSQGGATPGSGSGSGNPGGPSHSMMYTANPTQEAYPANLNPTHGGFVPSPSVGTNASGGQLPESDVDRIAARVASMMGGGLPAGAARPHSPGLSDFDAPPPMYNEKH